MSKYNQQTRQTQRAVNECELDHIDHPTKWALPAVQLHRLLSASVGGMSAVNLLIHH